jgi:threonine/homoserine/homoserine lactone efflux protein
LLCILVLSQVPGWMEQALFLASGLFILYLAYGAFQAWKHFEEQAVVPEGTVQSGILKAALMNALSPYPYIYWTLVTGPVLLRGWRELPLHGMAFVAGFYSMIILVMSMIILVFGTARRLGPKVSRALLGISALGLAGFGFYQLWLGITG